ncbi:MAG: metallophosphatase [Deltaproteobacteria bacterium]|nr:MAG: metallophosphatase [Deltaproteobacteria bacterium]
MPAGRWRCLDGGRASGTPGGQDSERASRTREPCGGALSCRAMRDGSPPPVPASRRSTPRQRVLVAVTAAIAGVLAAGSIGATLACGGHPASPAATGPRPVGTPPPGRVVAIGDLHADLDAALATLQLAGVADATGRWTGGTTVLVQTGDLTDRGPDSKEVIELLMSLRQQAADAGGRVVPLLGNHELMNMMGDWRYVTPQDIADFGSVDARRAAFSVDGSLGRWLIELDVAALVDDTVFVHGGIGERFAALGVAGINAQVDRALHGQAPPDILGEDGPLWNRALVMAPEPLACAELGRSLAALGARRMVVGHTPQPDGRILSRCNGQLLDIDTGISPYYGRHLAALEIVDGDARAIYPEGTADLPDP